jgi:LuxR family maltose regulon positive regulatory protein
VDDVYRDTLSISLNQRLPRLPARLVAREPLLRRLDRLATLTVLQSLPGLGKTTLVAAWAHRIRRRGTAVAWIRVTPELDDAHALGDLLGALAREAASVDGRTVVVLDDAHHLASVEAAEVVAATLADHDALHVVACQERGQHLLGTAIRHGLDTQVIRGSELSISADELPAWAEAWGHDVTAAQCEKLVALVGGWVLPLRLVLDATPSSSDAFAAHAAADFLEGRVLPGIRRSETLDVARRLALAETIDLPLATALVGPDCPVDASPTEWVCNQIARLERTGVLWPMPDDSAPGWQFPSLVRHALASAYEAAEPARARADHVMIGRTQWGTARSDLIGPAIRHARRGLDWALLEQIWLQESWHLLEIAVDDFAAAYADVPARVCQQHPALSLPAAVADSATGVADGPEQRTRFVMRHYMQVGLDYLKQPGSLADPADRIERLIAAMIGLRHDGRSREALALAVRIDAELPRVRRQERWGKRPLQTAWFLLQWGLTHLLAAQRGKAISMLTRAYETNPTGLTGSQSSALLALTHALHGENAEARGWLASHDAIDVSGWWAQSLALVPARLARASLSLDGLDGRAAAEALHECTCAGGVGELWPAYVRLLTRHALLFGDPATVLSRLGHIGQVHHANLDPDRAQVAGRLFDRSRAELLLAIGEVDQANGLLVGGGMPPAWLRVATARLHLMTGDAARTLRIASARAWTGIPSQRDRAELLMLGAGAAVELGRLKEAAVAFRQGHALCQAAGMLEPYLSAAPRQLEQLLLLADVTLPAELLDKIAGTHPPYPERLVLIDLSPREREILKHMRCHETAGAIARSLNVSVNTVRKQLVSLYAKLEVHDRVAALEAAERLGLFEESSTLAG